MCLKRITHQCKYLIILLSVVGLITFLSNNVSAQKIEIGGGIGVMHYKGDVYTSIQPDAARLGLNAFLRYNFSEATTFRLNFGIGDIHGSDLDVTDDLFRQQRQHVFNTRILEVSGILEYNFFDYQYRRYHTDWTPYIFGGIGQMYFNSKENPSPIYKTIGFVIPFGAGIKWRVNGPWNLGVEFGARKTFTDYLDNLGDNDPQKFKYRQQDYTTTDMYFYTGVSVSYRFYKIVCPR